MNPRVKIIVEKAKETWGKQGWKQLTPKMQEAYICREIVYSMLGQAEVSGTVMAALIRDAQEALRSIGDDIQQEAFSVKAL